MQKAKGSQEWWLDTTAGVSGRAQEVMKPIAGRDSCAKGRQPNKELCRISPHTLYPLTLSLLFQPGYDSLQYLMIT